MSRPAAVERPDVSPRRRLTVLPDPAPERAAAVIDLGSNSWRLVAYRYTPRGAWRRVAQLQAPVRIAKGLAATGRLDPERAACGLETLEMFARYAPALGIAPGHVDVVATSALRDAQDGPAFIARAETQTGLAIRTLTAEEEAHFGFLAAINSTTLQDGLTLDLGGGSLQLVGVRDRRARAFASWPLGAVRVSEDLLPGDRPASRKQLKRARAALRGQLAGLHGVPAQAGRLVGMGGAVRNLATAALRTRGPAAAGVQGARLTAAELRELIGELARRPPDKRALPGVKAARADIILGAALVLEAALELTGEDALEVTQAGLREGVFFAKHLLDESAPVLPDVRVAAVRNLAAQHAVDLERTQHVADLALGLHDSLAEAAVIRPARDERELLWAAAVLHEIGLAIDYGGQPTHARYVLLNSELYGHGPRERALLAQIVRYHRKGTPSLDDLAPLAGRGDARLVARCALLLRLAAQLAPGPDRAILAAQLRPDGDALRLELRGDDRLGRWMLSRLAGDEAFRSTFGRPLVSPG
jgi:exopolyphosphatase / guanosine-5'-triphosphate,3'-diphosphate pyrophosphatase